MHIVEILSFVLAIISWIALYDWFYFLGGFWAFLISLTPLTLWAICEEKIKDVPKEMLDDFERYIALRVIDDAWVEHINSMEHLKEGIGLRGYAQTNPLQAYALEGYDIFDKMQDNIDANIVNFLLKLNVNINRKPVQKGIANDGKETLKKEPATNKKKKIGRNDLCPCGSGKKYKQCCGK